MTIAEKLVQISENEHKVYNSGYDIGYDIGKSDGHDEGYDLGYEEGYRECEAECPKAVERSFVARENGNYKFTPADREVFSLVKVTVAVPDNNGSYDEGYNDGFEAGKAEGGGSGGATEGTLDTSFVLTSSGATCYCPANAEGGSSYRMMEFDSMGNYIAFAKFGVVEGTRHKVYCNPMGALWESFIFGMSDYSSTAIPTDDAHVGQYVSQVDNNTYIVTIPPNCANLFINVSVLGGCVAFLME